MPFGSIVAILCALFVIFYLPYAEKEKRKKKK
ncbi:erm Leader peptide [Staphylococcus caeli]